MRDLNPSKYFMTHGGCEIAPMSTTSSLEIAVRYAMDTGGGVVSDSHLLRPSALLFKFHIDHWAKMGADLSFLSAFPYEEEILYGPMTLIVPMNTSPRVLRYGKNKYTIIDAKVENVLS